MNRLAKVMLKILICVIIILIISHVSSLTSGIWVSQLSTITEDEYNKIASGKENLQGLGEAALNNSGNTKMDKNYFMCLQREQTNGWDTPAAWKAAISFVLHDDYVTINGKDYNDAKYLYFSRAVAYCAYHFNTHDHENNDYQKALWQLIYDSRYSTNYSSENKKVLGLSSYMVGYNYRDPKTGKIEENINETIWTNVSNILKGEGEKIYTGKFCILDHEWLQTMLLRGPLEEKDKNKPIILKFEKRDYDGKNKLEKAKIKVSKVENVKSINSTNITIGKAEIKVEPEKYSTGKFKIKLTEEQSPNEYVKINSITLTVEYNTDTGTVKKISGSTYAEKKDDTIIIKDPKAIKIKFSKKDFNGKSLDGATINVLASENIKDIYGLNNNGELKKASNGEYDEITVYPTKFSNGSFKLAITESITPNHYVGLPEKIYLTVKYDKTTGEVTSIESDNSTYITANKNSNDKYKVNVTVKNPPTVKLNFSKTDLNGTKLSGATIMVTPRSNVSKINAEIDQNDTGRVILTKDGAILKGYDNGTFKPIEVSPTDYTKRRI